jgi:O-antigen/teichoic acid export membrane protein
MLLVCRLGNAVQMIGWHRRYLIEHPFGFCRSKARELIRDGLAFTSAQAIAPLMLREGCKLLAAHLAGPAAAGVYAVLNQIATFIGGFIYMFTAPLWPALMDAAARHDYAWFNSARRRLWAAVTAYVGIAGIMLTLFGSWLIERWLGGQIHISSAVLLAFSCYFFISSWEHVNYICLTGLGIIAMPAALTVGEAVAALCVGWIGMQWGGIAGLLWGVCAVMTCASGWFFPYLLLQRMREWKNAGPVPMTISAVNI